MQVNGASVMGRAHKRQGRANQDAFAVWHAGELAAVAVADGCSSGRSSELGAGLAARFGVAAVARRAAEGLALDTLPAVVMADLTEHLATTARAWAIGGDTAQVVNDALLATLWVAVARGGDAVVFGVGDGVVCLDGAVRVIEQGDAPDYPAYGLFPHMTPPRLLVFEAPRYAQLIIATDGALPLQHQLPTLAAGPQLLRNPSLLQKRMNLVRDSALAPEDDCTLGVLCA